MEVKKKMKKLLTIALALVTALSMAVPAMAATTSVTVKSGAIPPIVKCKWEAEPDNNIFYRNGTATGIVAINNWESGDPTHQTPGTQINPPGVKNTTKIIDYLAVVTDPIYGGAITQVFADVFHPDNSPAPYNSNTQGTLLPGEQAESIGYFKYEIPFTNLGHGTNVQGWVTDAVGNGLVTFGTNPATNLPFTLAEIIFELDKGTADLWKGYKEIDYEQPAGEYQVYVYGINKDSALSLALNNNFDYLPVAGVEADFNGINFGLVDLDREKMVAGDRIWDANPTTVPVGFDSSNIVLLPNQATVRNIGNTWVKVKLTFTDMGFGVENGVPNVKFDARMGSDQQYYVPNILPGVATTLPNALGLSKQEELDLSINVHKGFATHNGSVTIAPVKDPDSNIPFAWPVTVPSYVVGVTEPPAPVNPGLIGGGLMGLN
jgi:hypothetical protein